jgi:hypothetical protein
VPPYRNALEFIHNSRQMWYNRLLLERKRVYLMGAEEENLSDVH